ncbi:MAG: glycosyltransferase family 2 protein [Alphaproteobacteria bacterium]
MQDKIGVSVVVPVKDEADNVAPLAREIAAALKSEPAHEIIFVDDGSTDGTKEKLLALRGEISSLRVIVHARNAGQSRAIRTGVRAAHAPIVVTLDGDGQNDPADIPKVLAPLRAGGPKLAMVSGVRAKRHDDFIRRLSSRVGNGVRQWALKDGCPDVGCSLKAFRRDAYLALPFFDHLHRFVIALMRREGYDVAFVDVNHRPRLRGTSKYNMRNRAFVGLTDIAGVLWLKQRFREPVEAKEL